LKRCVIRAPLVLHAALVFPGVRLGRVLACSPTFLPRLSDVSENQDKKEKGKTKTEKYVEDKVD